MTKHEYIEGFESGCNFIVTEIEKYAKERNIFLGDLISHLKGENKPYPVSDRPNDHTTQRLYKQD